MRSDPPTSRLTATPSPAIHTPSLPAAAPISYNLPTTNIDDGVLDGQYGQPIFLDTVIFKRQVKNGFFIEAGADDFEHDSNSLLFEMQHGWSGLLVEPNPTIYPKGFLKQRKAWAAPRGETGGQRGEPISGGEGSTSVLGRVDEKRKV